MAVAVGPLAARLQPLAVLAGRFPSRPCPNTAPHPHGAPARVRGGTDGSRRLRSKVFCRPSRRSNGLGGLRGSRLPHGPSSPAPAPGASARSPMRSLSPLRDVLPPAPARSAIFRADEPGGAASAAATVRRLWRGRCSGLGRGAGGRDRAGPEGAAPPT